MSSDTNSSADGSEYYFCTASIPPSQPSEAERLPALPPLGPSKHRLSFLNDPTFRAARAGTWVAFQRKQRIENELRIIELEKMLVEQTQRVAEATANFNLAAIKYFTDVQTFNANARRAE